MLPESPHRKAALIWNPVKCVSSPGCSGMLRWRAPNGQYFPPVEAAPAPHKSQNIFKHKQKLSVLRNQRMAHGITASAASHFSHPNSPANGSGLGLRGPTQSLLIGISPGRKEKAPWKRREGSQLVSTKKPQTEN